MNKKTLLISLPLLTLLAACGGPGESADIPEAQPAGATSVDIGNHVVHFSAQSTDQLPPTVAREYNIVRSKNRAMLTVSVIRSSDDAAVTAEVSVQTANLTGQLKNVTMRKVEDGSGDDIAIYYIGDTSVVNREVLIFDISVKPDDADEVAELRFKREFFSD